MKNIDVILAWKDEAYRASLSEEERALLPANPAGSVEINDAYLRGAAAPLPPTCCCSGWSCQTTCCYI